MQAQLNFPHSQAGELFGELLEEQALIDPEHHYEVSLPAKDDNLTADRTMIKQLLRALIDNSVKYTQKDGTSTSGLHPTT
jgi:K+-sensing histidine kinase KdpD